VSGRRGRGALQGRARAGLSGPRRRGGRRAQDVSVEVAACQLLLGDAAAAEATLGLAPGAPRAADPGVRDFVLVPPPPNLPRLSPSPKELGCGAGAIRCRGPRARRRGTSTRSRTPRGRRRGAGGVSARAGCSVW